MLGYLVINMRYLCDTNVLLEILLQRYEAIACSEFISRNAPLLALTDFGLFSFCIHAERYHAESFGFEYIHDLLRLGVAIIPTKPLRATEILFEKMLNGFDYDDYLQYRAAKDNNLTLVTLDKDFFKKKLDIIVLRPDQVR